jgi:uncharacterized sulfatase
MITRLDADVGKIFDLLKELKIDDNTLVTFASDNGPHREGGQKPQFFKSAGPFRDMKCDMFEGGIRVPLIANWPGKTPCGKTTDLYAKHPEVAKDTKRIMIEAFPQPKKS